MFSCVWLYFKKFSEKYFLVFGKCYKEKTNPEKHRKNPDWRSTLDWVRRRSASRAPIPRSRCQSRSREAPRRFARSRSTLRNLTIGAKPRSRSTARSRKGEASIVISRSTASIAIGAKARSRYRIAIDSAGACEQRGLELGACKGRGLVRACFSLSHSRFLSLSLSLSLRNSFEVKIGTKIHFRSQSLFFGLTNINFRKILFSGPTKHPHFWKSISRNDFHPKQTQP